MMAILHFILEKHVFRILVSLDISKLEHIQRKIINMVMIIKIFYYKDWKDLEVFSLKEKKA